MGLLIVFLRSNEEKRNEREIGTLMELEPIRFENGEVARERTVGGREGSEGVTIRHLKSFFQGDLAILSLGCFHASQPPAVHESLCLSVCLSLSLSLNRNLTDFAFDIDAN